MLVENKPFSPVLPTYGRTLLEPTGFPNRTDSTISFDDSSHELTISGNFTYYIHGIKYDISGSLSTAVTQQGPNFFYLDTNKQLQVYNSFNADILLRDNAYVAIIYWDNVDSKHIYFGDERHSIWWDWNHHEQQHDTVGTRYESGLGISDVTAFISIEHIYSADSNLWSLSIPIGDYEDFVVSSAQNHTPGGTYSLDFTGSENGDTCQFYKGTYFNLTNYSTLSGWIYITDWGPGDDISIFGWSAIPDIIVGSPVNLSSYVNIGSVNTWQIFNIPLSDMSLTNAIIDSIRIEMVSSGNPPSGFFDDLFFDHNYTVNDDALEFSVSDGVIWDEDLDHNIIEFVAGSSNTHVLYREGSDGNWTHDGDSIVFFKNFSGGNNRVAWNQYTGGVWVQSELPNNTYTLCHIFATNDPNYQIVGVQSQNMFSDLSSVRSAITNDINTILTGRLPFQELIAVASLVIRSSNELTNSYKASFVYLDVNSTETWQDFRSVKGVSTGSTSISDHGQLLGLEDDDHPQYINQTRGDSRYALQTLDNVDASVIWNSLGLQTTISNSSSSTTSNVFQNKLTINVTSYHGTVRLGFYMEYTASSAGLCEVQLYDVTDATTMLSIQKQIAVEDDYNQFTGFEYVSLGGVTKEFQLQYRQITSGNCIVRNAKFEVWRV